MNNLDDQLKRIQIDEIALVTSLSIISLVMAAFRMYNDYLTKAARRCKDLPPKEKSICMLKAKLYANNAHMKRLQSSLNRCNQTKNPEKCNFTLGQKIKKISLDIERISDRLKSIKPYDN